MMKRKKVEELLIDNCELWIDSYKKDLGDYFLVGFSHAVNTCLQVLESDFLTIGVLDSEERLHYYNDIIEYYKNKR